MAMYGARVEYALHTLLNLSYAAPDTAPSARDLADFQRLSVSFMRKLLTELAQAGLVEGSEGVRGGWRLARNPKDITVLDVVDALQGGDRLFDCREIRARCALWSDDRPPAAATTGVCSIHAVMLRAEAQMRKELAAHTLETIADQVRAKTSARSSEAATDWFTERFVHRRSAAGSGTE
jgi:Rrf2 family protein